MSSQFRAAVITLSDKGSTGEREDTSGPFIIEFLRNHGYEIAAQELLPDEQQLIEERLSYLADEDLCELIITTGGTGLSPRDVTPEATRNVIDRDVPGISEAIRAYSMTITKRAMLSRAVSGIRKQTLIINLPGSKKAVEESLAFIIDTLSHGLAIMRQTQGDCARE